MIFYAKLVAVACGNFHPVEESMKGQTFGIPRHIMLCMASLLWGCGPDALSGLFLEGVAESPCASGGKMLSGEISLPVRATQGSLHQVEVKVNGEAPIVDTSAPFDIALNTTKYKDGPAHLSVKGIDEDGNTQTLNLEVCIDNQAPAVEILSPGEDAEVAKEDARLEILVRATDLVSGGVAQIKAKLEVAGGTLETGDSSDPSLKNGTCTPEKGPDATCLLYPENLSLIIDPGQTESGTLSVIARDFAGHETTQQLSVTVKTRVKWTFQSAGTILSQAAVLPNGNAVFSANNAGTLYILTPNGQKVCEWTTAKATGEPIGTRPVANSDGSRVYFGTAGHLIVFDPQACTPLAQTGAGNNYAYSDPVLVESKGLVIIGRQSRQAGAVLIPPSICSYSMSSGAEIGCAEVSTGEDLYLVSSPAISADGNTAYVGSLDHSLYAVSIAADGKMAPYWKAETGNMIFSTPLVRSEAIYIASSDKFIHAFAPQSGEKLPSFLYKGSSAFHSSVIQSPDGSTLYVGNSDRFFYAIDRTTGADLAKFEIGIMRKSSKSDAIQSTSPVIGPDGQVIAACTASTTETPCRLNALHPKTLELQWAITAEIDQDGETFIASPVVKDTTVFIGNGVGKFYAIDAKPLPK
jgi:outer membrane protein assembly factor BamB